MVKPIRKHLELELIDRPDELARIHIDDSAVQELADSISERGLQNPIKVARKDARYMIIFGDRRVLAYKLLGLKKIEATVVDASDAEILIDRAIENIQRVDLTPVEEALQYKGMIDKAGMTVEQVARKVGKKPGSIKRRVEILAWPKEWKDAVHEGKMNITVAEELLVCGDPAHRSYLLEMAVEHGITSSVARLWVSDWKKSVAPRPDVADGGRGVQTTFFERSHYVGCELCDDPTKYEDLRQLSICQKCLRRLSAMLTNEGES